MARVRRKALPVRAALVFVPFLACGCYASHGIEVVSRDGGPVRRDAPAAPPDAPSPDGTYWTLERRESQLSVADFQCVTFVGGTAIVRVRVVIQNDCEIGGPVTVRRIDAGSYAVEAHVWVRHAAPPGERPCDFIAGQAQRDVPIPIDLPTVRVVDALSGSEAIVASRDDSHACSMLGLEGEPCQLDCDCAPSLGCVPSTGDFVECFGGECARICNTTTEYGRDGRRWSHDDGDCALGRECRRTGLAAQTCEVRTTACGAEGSCPNGRDCAPIGPVPECVWTIAAAPRVPCGSDADCVPGTVCVERRGARRCETPCFTGDMLCPGMQRCSDDGVCE
jgi:hypothetical protein